jgi:hypothetical protein
MSLPNGMPSYSRRYSAWTSTPAAISSAGHDVRARAGVLVHELAGVGDQADVQRVGDLRRGLDAEAAHQVPDDLGRARRLGHHVVDRAEARVVVVVVDVDDPQRVLGLVEDRRVAVDVAAVEEDDEAVGEVVGDDRDEALEAEEAVLVGQRELVVADEHQRVLAERGRAPRASRRASRARRRRGSRG